MRRALVTGATGGLGMALAQALLDDGYALRATGRDLAAGRHLSALGAEFVAADLTDPDVHASLCRDVDAIFHAAALSSPWGAREAFEAINLHATANLLAAARASGCDAFIYVSTPSIYAEARDRLDLTEESPLARRFANDYVATKYAAEQLALAAQGPDFAVIALRPRALIGPDDRQILPRLLRVARSGWFPVFHGGRGLIDLTDVRDAAQAAIAADRVRGVAGGQAFNISGGAARRVAEILPPAFAAARLRPRLVDVPYPAAAAACRLAEIACARLPGRPEPPATVYSLSTLAFSQTFDLTKARDMLGWRPRFTPEEAIAHAIQGGSSHAPL
jgi:2-alkyl-3-oxoalkanoate reductase